MTTSTSEKQRLLIIEDEPAILEGLIDVFVYHGYAVDSAMNGRVGLEMALSGDYALILLDIMLPSLDGFSVCNKIRETSREQPIIMLTAKSSEEDVISGLTLGADDYVAKPFSVRELVLRVATVLKRTCEATPECKVLTVAERIEIDTMNLVETSNRGGNSPLKFTRREIQILQYLQNNAARPVTREELLEKVWGYKKAAQIETRTVDIHIAKLRRKIEPNPKSPTYLITLRGEGYRLIEHGNTFQPA